MDTQKLQQQLNDATNRIFELERKMRNYDTILSSIIQNSTATKIYFRNQVQYDKDGQVGFFGATPAKQVSGLTLITHTSPTSADYALQDLTNVGGYGFATKDEGNTLLSVVKNIQQALKTLGITT